MKKYYFLLIFFGQFLIAYSQDPPDSRIISEVEYLDKLKAGWIGQMAGVGWGAPTEFKYNGMIIPEHDVPEWKGEMLNQHYQDDIYVEMTFLKTLEDHGFDVSVRQAGIDFANSRYMLWHANKAARDNLRSGIAPPFSGHPKFNSHADDIDYQIEADFSGLISPGMLQSVVDLGEKFGSIMNYGDGIYGGQFVAGMYSEAFFQSEVSEIINAGLKCIPAESQYAETIRDVIKWHQLYPDDWTKAWALVEEKYNLNPEYRKFSCNGTETDFNIDAKINGAYIVLGLLYGNGDLDSTIVISMRCGMDSDCNPSNAAGILATSIGFNNLPAKYKTGVDNETKFSFTAYNFPELLRVCESLTKINIVKYGGRVNSNPDGTIEYLIPSSEPNLRELKQSWIPDVINEDVKFSEKELNKITVKFRRFEDHITKWKYSGPYFSDDKGADELFSIEFEAETNPDSLEWEIIDPLIIKEDMGMVNLEKIIGSKNCAAYLHTSLWIDELTPGKFEIGSDDGIKVWLNKNLVHEKNIFRGHTQGEDVVEIILKKGWNEILLKVTQGDGGWGASLVITDLEGNPLKNFKYNF